MGDFQPNQREKKDGDMQDFLKSLQLSRCPICQTPIEYKENVGLSQYAMPCRHKLGPVLK